MRKIVCLDGEVWVDIEGYEGLYQISSFGRIKSLARTRTNRWGTQSPLPEIIMKTAHCPKGYVISRLCKDGHPKTFKVHRLVALHFVPNPNILDTVNHDDGVKNNNLVQNLDWMSNANNMKHAGRIGLRNKIPDEIIRVVKQELRNKTEQKMIAKRLNISEAYVSLLNKGSFRSNIP